MHLGNDDYVEFMPVLPAPSNPEDFTKFKQLAQSTNLELYLMMSEFGGPVKSRTYLWAQNPYDEEANGLVILIADRWDN